MSYAVLGLHAPALVCEILARLMHLGPTMLVAQLSLDRCLSAAKRLQAAGARVGLRACDKQACPSTECSLAGGGGGEKLFPCYAGGQLAEGGPPGLAEGRSEGRAKVGEAL